MPGPLLFFIFIVVIDLILKSAKDKKKIEEAKNRRTQELSKQPVPSRPMADLRKILAEEVEKERQKEIARRQGKTNQRQDILLKEKRPDINADDKKADINEISWEVRENGNRNSENKNSETVSSQNKIENNERNLREDILRGIIFSEILSEPKSLQNQRRSL
ncbi:hypothetical protein KQI38_16380 [Tissierella carlieri]|jgi:hypothetical protein|uniref:hypothetical protein n=1 Tax=Tissierella carlieri TaxID=689904 RepID=UPI001C119C94|nr:hypothetical protein [Tissierella carlieri]MBU5313601.1 hypothetical protein [Tissierella carlieri]